MFDQIKPGHVLRFAIEPMTIGSPQVIGNPYNNDNTLETRWTNPANQVGAVQLISHPSGALAPIVADVVSRFREGFSVSRAASYSAVGREIVPADRILGNVICDFVGYTEGKSLYLPSPRTVISNSFSGCLMVHYTQGGERRVAHSSASSNPYLDCKRAFLETLTRQGAVPGGWFRPIEAADTPLKLNAFAPIAGYVGNNPYRMTTFGVLTATGQGYGIDAFKPSAAVANDWIVFAIRRPQMYTTWTLP